MKNDDNAFKRAQVLKIEYGKVGFDRNNKRRGKNRTRHTY